MTPRRRASDRQQLRPFVDRWGIYLAIGILLAFNAVSFLLVQHVLDSQSRIINEQTRARIVQCERGNTTSISLRALANDLGASSAQIRLVAKRFPVLDCEHPTTVTTTTTTMNMTP